LLANFSLRGNVSGYFKSSPSYALNIDEAIDNLIDAAIEVCDSI
jgi:hypothetical protein